MLGRRACHSPTTTSAVMNQRSEVTHVTGPLKTGNSMPIKDDKSLKNKAIKIIGNRL